MVTKKKDPGYKVLRGHVPQELLTRFKIFAVERSLDNSQALELLLRERFDSNGEISIEDAVNIKSAQN